MKNIFQKIFTLLLISVFFIPQITFAAWWNPLTWKLFNKPTETKTEKPAISPIKPLDTPTQAKKEETQKTQPTKIPKPKTSKATEKVLIKNKPAPKIQPAPKSPVNQPSKPVIKDDTTTKVENTTPATNKETTSTPSNNITEKIDLANFNNKYNDFVYQYSAALNDFETGLSQSKSLTNATAAKNSFTLALNEFKDARKIITELSINSEPVTILLTEFKNNLYLATDARITASQHGINLFTYTEKYEDIEAKNLVTMRDLNLKGELLNNMQEETEALGEKMYAADNYMKKSLSIKDQINKMSQH